MRSKAVSGYSILTRLVHLVGQLWWILGCNTWSLFFGTKKSLPHAGSVGYWPHPKLNAFPGFPLNLRKLSHPSFHSLSPGVAPMQWLLNEKSPISLLSVGVNCEGPSQLQRSPGVQRKQKAPASQFTSSLCSFELFFTVFTFYRNHSPVNFLHSDFHFTVSCLGKQTSDILAALQWTWILEDFKESSSGSL